MSMHALDYTKKIDKIHALEIPFVLFCKLGNEVGRNIDQWNSWYKIKIWQKCGFK